MERQHPHPPTPSASWMQAMNVRMAIMAAMARPYSVDVIIWGAGLEVDITGYLNESKFMAQYVEAVSNRMMEGRVQHAKNQ